MVAYAEEAGCSLGRAALAYEAALLGLPPAGSASGRSLVPLRGRRRTLARSAAPRV